jgi:hypothetical protein
LIEYARLNILDTDRGGKRYYRYCKNFPAENLKKSGIKNCYTCQLCPGWCEAIKSRIIGADSSAKKMGEKFRIVILKSL